MSDKVGRYEIKAELGRGGMATVYRAYDPRFERDVALKVLPREFLHDPTFRARFEREAKTIASLEYPAIVPVYDFGEESGQPYLVMRFMPGGSLADCLVHGPQTIAEAARIFARLAPALDEAHKRGIIHRDLKPGNILFDQYGEAYLSDFGIVKLTEASAAYTGITIIGTPAYMSPEHVEGKVEVDGRSDVYSLGVLLFEMLTGQTPYDADTPVSLAMKHVLEPVPRVLEVDPALPPACEAVIARAMAKDRDERYPTVTAMARAVEELVSAAPTERIHIPETVATPLASEPRPAPQPPAVVSAPPARPRPKRRRGIPAWVWIFGGLAAVAGLMIALTGLLLGSQARSTARANATATAQAQELAAAQAQEVATAQVRGTATAQAQETATARARETATAQAHGTATTQALRTANAQAQMTAWAQEQGTATAMMATAENSLIISGPHDGSLPHKEDDLIEARRADVDVRDFVVLALLYNPYPTTRGEWDYGFLFRHSGQNSHFRLVVDSSGDWVLRDRQGDKYETVDEGHLTNLNVSDGGGNGLMLIAEGNDGFFYVNGVFVARLDLSSRTNSGDVAVATGMIIGHEIDGEVTQYEFFTVGSFP